MNDSIDSREQLEKEIAYYKKQLDQMSGESIRHDYIRTSLRHELKQKKDAFAVLTILQKKFTVTTPLDVLFTETIKAINGYLGMDRSVVLIPSEAGELFKPAYSYGYPASFFNETEPIKIHLPPSYVQPGGSILVNKKVHPDETGVEIQNKLSIAYFAGVPVLHEERAIAFIISGRQVERIPFNAPLDKGDIDTLTAINALISSVIQNKRVLELRIQKAELEKQREAVTEQRDILERTLTELRNTQAQLIQKEKMASLGELTAGIAHEIQNPLNFVNNFSEVNGELVDELKTQLATGNLQLATEIADDLKDNETKILYHGKRADAIVKGMLQHSRVSTGQKELTDINALADEYLRLTYHGMRATDKNFNAALKTDFDENIGKINVIPQDIGRVLLNLYNNAFYATADKLKARSPQLAAHSSEYVPTVTVVTKKADDKVLISVKDNGPGIPQHIVDKIFQPFFTTKPTGEGTGLGLSLAYDIIKAHGGEIKVETKEHERTTFIIQLPL